MENADVARVLSEIADILELTGGNALKVRAYRQAAQVVDLRTGPIAEEWRRDHVTELPGIGEAILPALWRRMAPRPALGPARMGAR